MKTVKTLSALDAAGLLPDGATSALEEACARLPLGITHDLMDLIDVDDPEDPIRAQFVPSEAEAHVTEAELRDPIGDEPHSPVPGIVHRYPDRVLFNCVTSCAAYCRFCFRRSAVGKGEAMLGPDETQDALNYIAKHREIREVIFSGGDPLTMSDRRIALLVEQLNAIAHVEVIRFHTRIPVVDPQRITGSLVRAFEGRCPVYLLLHCNHPRELSKQAREALGRLSQGGVVLLSQSVLLAGVNDDVDVLEKLMRAFLLCRVVPHYIHHPDLAEGTAHFRLSLERGMALMQELRLKLSGLCQPTYILEIPGGHGKIPVNPGYIAQNRDGSWRLMGPDGSVHTYRDEI